MRFSFPSCRTFFLVYVSGMTLEDDCHRQSAFEIVLIHETWHSVVVVRHVFWSHLLCGHSKFAPGPSLLLGKPWTRASKSKTPYKLCKKKCLDTMIGGHSKFLLVTGGGVAKRDDNRCPALQSFEERACSAAFVVPALCWCCGSFQIPCASFFGIGILNVYL